MADTRPSRTRSRASANRATPLALARGFAVNNSVPPCHPDATRICAVDVGTRNPARTVVDVITGSRILFRVVDISKLDWSAQWERRVVFDVCSVGADVVLIEKQQHRSPHSKIAPFVRGVTYGSGTRVLLRNPVMRGGSYRARKRRSVALFLHRLAVLNIDASGVLGRKLDDVADSFNMAIEYVMGLKPDAAAASGGKTQI